MRTTLMIGALILLTSCTATAKPELDVQKTANAIGYLGSRDKLFTEAFGEVDARIRVIEQKLKIPSPVIPTPKATPVVSVEPINAVEKIKK